MGQLGKLEMKFDHNEKVIELKMANIDPVIQFQIMELCMKGVHGEVSSKPEKKQNEAPEQERVISKSGLTEDEVKAGYQAVPNLTENKELPSVNKAPKINTYSEDKSIQIRNGVKHYQLFYICPDCGNKGKRHITPGTPKIRCHKYDCGHEMMVRLATPKGLPDHDEWGNYYIAGEFKMSMKDKEDEEEFLKEQEDRLLFSVN